MKKNLIVITGGAGFVGSNMIKYLLNKTNYNLISLDNYFTGTKKNHVKNKRVKYIKGETKNISNLFKNFKKKILVIFHFGEFSRIAQSFKYSAKCFDYNLVGTHNVLKFAYENNIKIVYSATSSMLGNKGANQNLSPYTWCKAKNIEIIKNYNRWFKLKYEIVFFFNVYGEGQIKNNEMAAVIGVFEYQYNSGKPLTVVRPGTQKRDFTHINDITRGTYLVWRKSKNKEHMLGTNKRYTILEVAKMFKSKIKMIKERPGERFNSQKIKGHAFKDLGFKPNINIKNYIKNYIRKH